MKHCRLCSQRLTRPGRLCRECECELARARYAGLPIGELAPAVTSADTSRMAGGEWLRRARAPGSMVAIAFAIGIAATVTLQLVERSEAAVAGASVMLGSQFAPPREVSIVSPGAAAAQADLQPVPVAAGATVDVRSGPLPAKPATHEKARVASATPIHGASVEQPATPPASESVAAPARDAGAALGEALARCGDGPFLARPDFEERARARYCEAATPLPQCVAREREYGQ